MYRRDYILRLIEQFSRVLAVLLNKITGRQMSPAEVHAQVAEIAVQSGLQLDVARSLDPTMLLMWLAPRGEIDPGKFWLMAELLFLEGMQAHEEGLADRARADLQRARVILSRLEADWRPQPDLASVAERLEAIAAMLGPEGR
jgi:hypothetical protein